MGCLDENSKFRFFRLFHIGRNNSKWSYKKINIVPTEVGVDVEEGTKIIFWRLVFLENLDLLFQNFLNVMEPLGVAEYTSVSFVERIVASVSSKTTRKYLYLLWNQLTHSSAFMFLSETVRLWNHEAILPCRRKRAAEGAQNAAGRAFASARWTFVSMV